ncbi:MAG: porphobilinogen synthase [Alphaproteobacteria bacterium]
MNPDSRPLTPGTFPATRLRRPRMQAWSRTLVREHHLRPENLVLPLFVIEGHSIEEPVASLSGVSRLTIDKLVQQVKSAASAGISAVGLFPVIDSKHKTPGGEHAFDPDNLMCRAIRALKDSVPDVGIIADVALDPYTSHGQDGVVENGVVMNDATVEVLCQQALVQAAAGCDIIAPSDMMDGRIGAIRTTLEQSGYHDTMILSYAAKYASSLYGPFRDAVGSAGNLGKADKRSYQMDPANSDEALREVAIDIAEGADMVMVKPGLAYLDIIARVKQNFNIPIAAFHVSGEYAMVKAASANGWLDGDAVMMEHLLAIKRAGANMILTYAALDVARKL